MPLTTRAIGDESFVSLTTFRRTGVGVPTTVWLVRDGEDLLVTTPATSGKVKRLRNDSRVELRPSSRTGKVADDAPVLTGTAEVRDDAAILATVTRLMRAKYGLQYRVLMLVEKLSRKQGNRVIVRITPA
ncbi:PPOX class F420-dependent oxidoreductase [Cellulomonas rhizosphaerae]|uniref:PPOX class F420-dependent oxidoreductase n=1 Tax=Cellulomonas rhizosphaerae TaxID=2293719 RepID=A0A413RLM3_9CELL|nr:PPOX class F420-dependent oxidoreductase [Cellulomonas rhizosphaerae]RHA41000.1 PPOX class F420-dependent oxidoreductase [Cellulomonas rhizosphaerae]